MDTKTTLELVKAEESITAAQLVEKLVKLNPDALQGDARLHVLHLIDEGYLDILQNWKLSINPWMRLPVLPEQLAKDRELSLKDPQERAYIEAKGGFTCDTCVFAPKCTLAFDHYNTDGDCLYRK